MVEVRCRLLRWNRGQQTLLLEGADGLRAQLHRDLFTVDHKRLGLQVRLPYLFGVALREADIAAILFAFTGEIAYLHDLSRLTNDSICYCNGFNL